MLDRIRFIRCANDPGSQFSSYALTGARRFERKRIFPAPADDEARAKIPAR